MNHNNPSTLDVFKIILGYCKKHSTKIYFLGLLTIFTGLVPTLDSILLKIIIDTLAENIKSSHYSLFWWAIIYALWWESINICYRIYNILYLKFMPVLKGEIASDFYGQLQHYNHTFFQSIPSGQLSNYIMEAYRSVEMIYIMCVEKLLRKAILIVASYLAIYSVHPTIATIYALWLIVFLGINALIVKRMGLYARKFSENKSTLAGRIVDAFTNINSIRMANNYEHERKYLGRYISNTVQSDQTMLRSLLTPHYLLGMSCNCLIFFVIYFLGSFYANDEITIGDFVLIISLCTNISGDLWDSAQDVGDLFEDVNAFKQSISKIYCKKDKVDLQDDLQITEGKIEFKRIDFSYHQDDNLLFRQKNLIIKGKQKIGLVGFSGSGKTTLINLICKLYDVDNGSISIDNQDIQTISEASLRRAISIIPQNPTLFNRSIRENIAYGITSATDEEVIEASKRAYLHDFVMSLPEGYNTLCTEQGGNLSGGQKQRISIARNILKNSPILILDEATSALDSVTEKQIQESLEYLMHNKTIIVIAHRLGTVVNMDRILVFQNGAIIQDGNHASLIASNGLYRNLWSLQLGGNLPDLQ